MSIVTIDCVINKMSANSEKCPSELPNSQFTITYIEEMMHIL